MTTRFSSKHFAHFALVWAVMSGCASNGLDVDSSRGGGGHKTFDVVELLLADTGELLAQWSREGGWRGADGAPLVALPPSVVSGDTLEPLRAGGAPASLEVVFLGSVDVDIAPIGAGDSTSGNPCGEFSARYFPLDDETPVIAWANIAHPEHPKSVSLFAARHGGELVQIFHCDRLDIYPEQAGVAQLEILLWHVNHADQASDALTVEVLEAD